MNGKVNIYLACRGVRLEKKCEISLDSV